MKRSLRRVLLVLLALIFAGCCAKVVYQMIQYRQGDQVYAEAEALVQLPDFTDLPVSPPQQEEEDPSSSTPDSSQQEEPEAPVYVDPYADALRNMDFSALQEVNSDILGWILIPNTRVSYPLVQGDDNDYYLNRTWRKTRNSVGAIFMEWQNSSDLSDFNTIIYGHRMNNSSMFGTLKSFESKSFWSSHPYVYITDDNGSHRYEIFAAYEVSVEGDTYRLGFSSDATKQSFIDYCLAQSVIDTGIVPTIYDRILTLSTCTGNGHATRWVVQAVLKGEAPSDTAQQPQEEAPSEQPSGDAQQPQEESPTEQPSGGAQSSVQAADGQAGTAPEETPDTSNPETSTPEEEPRISQDIRKEDLLT